MTCFLQYHTWNLLKTRSNLVYGKEYLDVWVGLVYRYERVFECISPLISLETAFLWSSSLYKCYKC